MERPALISCGELMLALCDLCLSKQTGTMLIVTEDNCSVQIALQQGSITACRAGLKEGVEALQGLKTAKSGRYSFHKAAAAAGAGSAPPPAGLEGLLHELTGGSAEAAPGQRLSPAELGALKRAVKEELAGTIGPIAGMICDDCFDRLQGHSPGELVRLFCMLTFEVETKKMGRFRERLIARLQPFPLQQALAEYAKISEPQLQTLKAAVKKNIGFFREAPAFGEASE